MFILFCFLCTTCAGAAEQNADSRDLQNSFLAIQGAQKLLEDQGRSRPLSQPTQRALGAQSGETLIQAPDHVFLGFQSAKEVELQPHTVLLEQATLPVSQSKTTGNNKCWLIAAFDLADIGAVDGAVDSDEWTALMTDIDNGDTNLEKGEFLAYASGGGKKAQAECDADDVAEFVGKVDSPGGDGVVSADEWMAFFGKCDTSNDGKCSANEWADLVL